MENNSDSQHGTKTNMGKPHTSWESNEPLSIRSYPNGSDYLELFSERPNDNKVKNEPMESSPMNKSYSNYVLKKFVPNIQTDRHKLNTNIEHNKISNENTEISTNLMMARILNQSQSKNKLDDLKKPHSNTNSHHSIDKSNLVKSSTIKEGPYHKVEKIKKNPNQRSKILQDLSLPHHNVNEGFDIYTPIRLPFVEKSMMDLKPIASEESEPIINSTTNTSYSTINIRDTSLLDEISNESCTNLDDSNLTPISFLHIQLPTLLPEIATSNYNSQASTITKSSQFNKSSLNNDENYNSTLHQPSSFKDLPKGKIGKLTFYQSGKVRLNLDDHIFQVNYGSNCSFAQEVGCFLNSSSELIYLGQCSRRIIIIPEVQGMVSN